MTILGFASAIGIRAARPIQLSHVPSHMLLCLLSCILLFISCAATVEEIGEPVAQPYYYDPASPDRNKGYFDRVRDHFYRIGTNIPSTELELYTATRNISASPREAAIYVGTRFMGLTNRGDLYFKPGQYTVEFSAGGTSWSEILTFAEGRNAALMVRRP